MPAWGWDGTVGLPLWSTPVGARLSVVVWCGVAAPPVPGMLWLLEITCRSTTHPGPGGVSALCEWGWGLCSRDAASSPRSDLNGPRPNFKGMTFSAMTVITRRLRNTQAC